MDNPESPLSELPLLSDAERHQLLVTWNQTDLPYSNDRCFHHLFEEQAELTPDAPAVRCGEEQLTYSELNGRANQFARRLQGMGVGPETLVGICLTRSVGMVAALLGVMKAGGAYVPLDPAYPAERLAFMLEDARVPVLVTERATASGFGFGIWDFKWSHRSEVIQNRKSKIQYPGGGLPEIRPGNQCRRECAEPGERRKRDEPGVRDLYLWFNREAKGCHDHSR